MPSMVDRLQAHLEFETERLYRPVPVPPFTLFLSANGSGGVAMPSQPNIIDWSSSLEDLRAACRKISADPVNIAFIDHYAPGLAADLEACGCRVQRQILMVCTPQQLHQVAAVPDIHLTWLDSTAPDADLRTFIHTNAQGFNLLSASASLELLEKVRAELVSGRAVLAHHQGQPVAAGMFSPINDSLTQLSGITTLKSHRRQGIGAWITFELARMAFELGVEAAYLIAQDDAPVNVYQRAGFHPTTHYCTCRLIANT